MYLYVCTCEVTQIRAERAAMCRMIGGQRHTCMYLCACMYTCAHVNSNSSRESGDVQDDQGAESRMYVFCVYVCIHVRR